MKGKKFVLVAALMAASGWAGWQMSRTQGEEPAAKNPTFKVVGGSPEQIGKYLIKVGGCNDCHTPGFMQKGNDIPETEWLTGVPVGWQGPWGTTYGTNLRRFIKDMTQEQFIQILRARNQRPPMPWTAVHAMSDEDLGAVYAYIKSLEGLGPKSPEYVPPGEEPKTPYLVLEPKFPKGMEGPPAGK